VYKSIYAPGTSTKFHCRELSSNCLKSQQIVPLFSSRLQQTSHILHTIGYERTEKDSACFVDSKETNEWVLNKAGVKRELRDTVKARKLAYYGHTMRKQGNCLEKKIMQGTMAGVRRRGRPRTAWIDNIKSWTGLSVEESLRMTEDRNKWRKYRVNHKKTWQFIFDYNFG